MEEVVQRVFAILISVIILFILPLYIAFEKKDDIAYALALKVTTSFVDNVTSKGYLTLDMYDKFISDLSITDNVYDISLEYIAKEYNPIVQVKKKDVTTGIEEIVKEYDYLVAKELYDEYVAGGNTILTNNGVNRSEATANVTYKLSEKKYYTNQILNLLDNTGNYLSKSAYSAKTSVTQLPNFLRIYGESDKGMFVMNEGDQFNVIIKNQNTTVASLLFNTLTFGANAGNDTKVYVNYGGTIQNQEYM